MSRSGPWRTVSRRNLLKGMIVLGAGGALGPVLAACTRTTPATSPAEGEQPAGTSDAATSLIIGTIPEFTTLDPNNLLSIENPLHRFVFDNLVYVEEHTLEPVPQLAETWELAPDAMSMTFHLRKGVRFHSGRELTAADVVKNLERTLNPETGLAMAGSFGVVAGATAPDPATVVFQFKQPTPNFFGRLVWWSIQDPDNFEQARNSAQGTGPFKFVNWVPGDSLTLERNPDYWGDMSTNLDRVTYKFFADPEAMTIAALGNTVDMVMYGQVKDADRLRDAGWTVQPPQITVDYLILWLNPTRPSALQKVKIRQAVARSIDRTSVAGQILFGLSEPTQLPVPQASPAYDETLAHDWDFNLDEARRLVQESGIANPEFTVVTTPAFPELVQTAELLQAHLAEIGVTMNIDTVDGNTHSDRGVKGDYEALFWFASAGIIDPVDFEDNSGYRTSTGIVFGGPDGVPRDYLNAFQAAAAEIDPGERAARFKQVFRILHQHAWAVPIAWRPVLMAQQPGVSGVAYGASTRLLPYDIARS